MINSEQYGNMIEINVTDSCQLSCNHCNRLCNVANNGGHISLAAIEEFCAQAPRFKRICIAGGEPMLHPEIEQILSTIVAADIADEVLLLTNGIIPDVWFHGVTVRNSNKQDQRPDHNYLMTVAAEDLNLFWLKPPSHCDMLKRCGLGYSAMGYYPCCLSAAIGRVFRIPGAASLDELTEVKYHELLDETCRYCGYYLTSKDDSLLPPFNYPKGMMSPSWVKALELYNGGY